MSNFAETLLHGVTLVIPLTIAGVVFIAAMWRGWFRALDVPLDGGIQFRRRPLIGPSKTLRSIVVYAVVGTAFTVMLHWAQPGTPWIAPLYRENPFVLGPMNAVVYVAGEVLNSFVKRRLGIVTSALPSRTGLGLVQAIIDNIDGTLASGLFLLVAYDVPGETLAVAFVLSFATHLSTDALMRRIGLKRRQ